MQRRHWHGRTTFRGYRRSDERIREEIYERLMDHPGIDTSDMDVTVSNGEVTLEGTVDDRWEKRLAEDLAESVSGVTDVHNRLRTSNGATDTRGATPMPAPTSTPTVSPSGGSGRS
jgi:osmotically-inducible protein OsmY